MNRPYGLSPAPLEPAEYKEKAKIGQIALTKSIGQFLFVSFFSANPAASARNICFHFLSFQPLGLEHLRRLLDCSLHRDSFDG